MISPEFSNYHKRTPQHIAEKIRLGLDMQPLDFEPSEIRIHDKWLLSSALQKLIRRGKAREAIAVARWLHEVDPQYLPRRLPIIAMEDVGLGNASGCAQVLALCSSRQWWQNDAHRTIAYAVSLLAESVKSRAACDAYCLGDSFAETHRAMAVPLQAAREELIDVASDRAAALVTRINALRALGGVSERRGRFAVVVRPCDPAALLEVAMRLELPPLLVHLMTKQARSAGLAAMLPIANEAADQAVATDACGRAVDLMDGIPLVAVDQFSAVGKSVVERLRRACRPLREQVIEYVEPQRQLRAINMALFHIESSLLDRRLSSPSLDELTEDTESIEMLRAGLRQVGQREDFYGLMRESLPDLNAFRAEALRDLRKVRG